MRGEECMICGEHVIEFSFGQNDRYRRDNRELYHKALALIGGSAWWTCWDCWDGIAEQAIGAGMLK